MGALPTPGTRVTPPRLNGLGDEPDTTGMPLILIRPRQVGLLCLLVTIVGWGLNWPVMKFLLREWPPLSARGTAGVTAALALALLAALRGERLAVPVRSTGRLLAAAGLNVTAWMGLSTLSLLWLDAGQGALLVYTMPIWATILAWPVLGERPTVGRILALVLGVVGVTMLLGGVHCARPEMLPGVACALGGVLFALGTVALRSPLGMPPLTATAWQVGLGCLPMIAVGMLLEAPDPAALSPAGWAAMAYMTAVPMAACYLCWFAALRRLPPAMASMGTLLTPLVGVVAAAVALGEPLGVQQMLALALTLGGVSLAIRQRVESEPTLGGRPGRPVFRSAHRAWQARSIAPRVGAEPWARGGDLVSYRGRRCWNHSMIFGLTNIDLGDRIISNEFLLHKTPNFIFIINQ